MSSIHYSSYTESSKVFSLLMINKHCSLNIKKLGVVAHIHCINDVVTKPTFSFRSKLFGFMYP